eukprot:CAMPEP_0116873448 /NCGR_PEP_ID=MMETSP0463-20121206/4560_1 /TAXON_ID=181622 /ORGANISM="Strombidinopsis sp, Strain SopsisLIS2011" /LENGTH=34 /DNA_ID= /DNA_START= /DNA_END= /DNA_ORIENTATION=
MVRVHISVKMVKKDKVNGKMEKESDGCTRIMKIS